MNNFARDVADRRQTVLILSSQKRTDATGVRVYCDALERMFQSIAGVNVIRICWSDSSLAWQRLVVLLLKVSRLLGRGAQQVAHRWGGAMLTWRLLREYRLLCPIVLAQDPISGAVAQWMGLKVWCVCHFSDPIEEIYRAEKFGPITRRMIAWTMRFFLARNERYIVLSSSAAKMMEVYAPKSRREIIPTICRYDVLGKPKVHEGVRMVMMGRLEDLKGQRRLVEALGLLKDMEVELWLLGEGPDRMLLEEAATRNGVREKVKFLGFVADPRPLLQQCDLYIHSSRMEAFALVCVEAIVSGVPAWSYETPGYNDFHCFDGTPYLPQTTSAQQLANYIREFVKQSPESRKRLLEQQQACAKRFLPKSVQQAYCHLLGID